MSYLDVLDGAIDMLAGKTVFVGATALELGDTMPVPVHRALPGVVAQATAYATLLEGNPHATAAWVTVVSRSGDLLQHPVATVACSGARQSQLQRQRR